MLGKLLGRKYISDTALYQGMTDYHSHILPGVDDGVPTLNRALDVLDYYQDKGIKKVIFTPHVMEMCPNNNYDTLQEAFETFKENYKGNVELSLGAEYMLDSSFESHLEGGRMLTLFDNYLLVEMSYVNPSLDFMERLSKVRKKGYFVVLAHPERYLYLTENDYEQLRREGVKLQLNLMSLTGTYGEPVRKRAIMLLDKDYYDFFGTDLHKLPFYRSMMKYRKLSKKIIAQLLNLKH